MRNNDLSIAVNFCSVFFAVPCWCFLLCGFVFTYCSGASEEAKFIPFWTVCMGVLAVPIAITSCVCQWKLSESANPSIALLLLVAFSFAVGASLILSWAFELFRSVSCWISMLVAPPLLFGLFAGGRMKSELPTSLSRCPHRPLNSEECFENPYHST